MKPLKLLAALPILACFLAASLALPGGAPILLGSVISLFAVFFCVRPEMVNIERRGWFVAILVVFAVGYFWNTARSYLALTKGWDWTEEYAEFTGISENVLESSFLFIALSFVVFMVVSWLLCRLTNETKVRVPIRRTPPPSRPANFQRATFAALMLLALCVLGAKIYFGIGIMGLDVVRLPFYLDKVLNRMHSFLTIILIFSYWRLDDAGDRFGAQVAATGVILFLVAGGLYSGSRNSFIQAAISFGTLWYFSGRLTKQRFVVVVGLIVATIFYFPVASALRIERIYGTVKTAGDFFSVARESSTIRPHEIGDISSDVSRKVLDRFVGAPALWQAFRVNLGDGIDWRALKDHFLLRKTISSVFTTEVVGVQAQNDFRSPGVLGFLWLVGGYYSILLWMVMILIYFLSWEWFRSLSIRPVAQSAGFGFTLFSVNEGTFLIQDLATFYVVLWIIEVLNRYVLTHQHARPVR